MTNNTLPSFPQRVYSMLAFSELQGRQDIISWENNGTAFKVNDLDAFERDLLPKFLNTKKYNTFTRALHSHGFTCVRTGRHTGIYSHPRFNRADPVSPHFMTKFCPHNAARSHAPEHHIESPVVNPSDNRLPGPRPAIGQVALQSPKLPCETAAGNEDDSVTATAFGRSYHTIASKVSERVTSLPLQLMSGSELTDMFECEGENMDDNTKCDDVATRSQPNHSQSSAATNPNILASSKKPQCN